ncbi:Uncharacterized protein ChrSV_3947 [Chromobacterium vaccinii]|nr:Uncharacterized protein ChrSW_3947 [Chromobacterium vaccinii]QND91404.1 Uncharacterized protein ChrSV_3947 [Chromobacterium vaccinii]
MDCFSIEKRKSFSMVDCGHGFFCQTARRVTDGAQEWGKEWILLIVKHETMF